MFVNPRCVCYSLALSGETIAPGANTNNYLVCFIRVGRRSDRSGIDTFDVSLVTGFFHSEDAITANFDAIRFRNARCAEVRDASRSMRQKTEGRQSREGNFSSHARM